MIPLSNPQLPPTLLQALNVNLYILPGITDGAGPFVSWTTVAWKYRLTFSISPSQRFPPHILKPQSVLCEVANNVMCPFQGREWGIHPQCQGQGPTLYYLTPSGADGEWYPSTVGPGPTLGYIAPSGQRKAHSGSVLLFAYPICASR